MRYKKILLTGATGFIGINLLEKLLHEDYEVHCLVRKKNSLASISNNNLKVYECDITDASSIQRIMPEIDIIIHLAGLGLNKMQNDFNFNVLSTYALLTAAAKFNKLHKFIFISSIKADIKNRVNVPQKEAMDIYRHSKYQSEWIVDKFCSEHNINYSIVRLPAVFGPHDKNFLPLIKCIQNGIIPILTNKQTQEFSAIYVKDAVDNICTILNSDSGKYIELDCMESITWNNFVRMIQKITNTKTKITIPINWIYKILTYLSFNQVILARLEDICVNSWKFLGDKHLQIFKNHPYTPLEEALSITIEWYKKAGIIQ